MGTVTEIECCEQGGGVEIIALRIRIYGLLREEQFVTERSGEPIKRFPAFVYRVRSGGKADPGRRPESGSQIPVLPVLLNRAIQRC